MGDKVNTYVTLGAVVVFSVVAVSAQPLGRSQRPDATPSLMLAIEKRQLSNGLPVWIVERHDVQVVQLSLVVLGGAGNDPPGKYGIASFTSAMLTEGAGSHSGLELADAIDRLGANLSASSGFDASSLQLSVPVGRLADALPLMADVAERPTFPVQELEHVRQQRLATLLRGRDDPDAIASLASSRLIYGPSHRYGTPLIGSLDTIATFTREDLRAFHESTYRPGNSTLIVVGDVVPDEVLPRLEAHFGTWQPPGLNDRMRELPPAAQSTRRLLIIDMPNAPQSRILIGGVGAPRSTPDFFPIQAMTAVLGNRLSSRLGNDAAGAWSGFDLRRSPGPFLAAAAVLTDKTAESLTGFFDELTRILTEVPPDELARAKNDIALQFPRTFEATGRISSRLQALESLLVYGLPDDYYSRYVQAIQAVSAVDVQRVAQKYIQPDRLAVVIVGDRRTIEPRIRALNLGLIEGMTIEEVFAQAK